MKKIITKAVSAVLCFAMVLSCFVFAAYAENKTVSYGSYPQSLVKDSGLISALNALEPVFGTAGFYSGEGGVGTAGCSDFVKYADVSYGGEKYRAVKIEGYRPYISYKTSAAENSYQDENGYEAGETYWFRYEPIVWKILDADKGLVISEKLIDAHAFCPGFFYDGNHAEYYSDSSKTKLANDYSVAEISKWLEKDFTAVSFSASELEGLNESNGKKISLPCTDDVTTYFSANEDRKAQCTDYAACEGIFISRGSCGWLLSDAEKGAYDGVYASSVSPDGEIGKTEIFCSYNGIRPLARIDSVIPEYKLTFVTDSGEKVSYLRKDAKITVPEDIGKTGYSFTGWDKTLPEKMPGNDLTLTAQYSINTYKAVWNMNGTSVTTYSRYGENIIVPRIVQKEGALFTGWDKEIPSKMPAENLEFNAVYEDIKAASIRITRQPANKKYDYKSRELNLNGIEIEITQTDGRTFVTKDTSLFKFSGFDTSKVGQKDVTVELDGCTDSFKITVKYTWWQNLIRILLLGFLWY